MKNNTRTNSLIKWLIILGDFVILNALLLLLLYVLRDMSHGGVGPLRVFVLICNVAMIIGESRFSTIIHQRLVDVDSIIKRTTLLVITTVLVAYVLLRALQIEIRVGLPLLNLGVSLIGTLLIARFLERWIIKKMRRRGFNTRAVTLVGSHEDLRILHDKLVQNPTLGYKIRGYYGSLDFQPRKGSLDDFARLVDTPDQLEPGDELYLCVPRTERALIKKTDLMCDRLMVKFYYVPIKEENLKLQSVMLDDMELFTTFVSPLEEALNRVVKRAFDLIVAVICLLLTAPIFPVVALIIKLQSPGPIFFKQKRTGIDGREFLMYKFRSMHVNADADRLQATEDDPRKYPFGNLMRKTNIDELPQFWNVLRGDMSIVGPRPHMLAHTEQYSRLIDKYMIRHFVKPGVTGWAQVTGFRGETKELWQMEGRVEQDIWYIQHWSIWLDIRIIWRTFKTIFIHDKNAY